MPRKRKVAPFDETDFTLDELNFDLDELNFDLDETKFGLDEVALVERRWKHTEKALKRAFPLVRKYYRELGDDVLDIVNELKIDPQKLNDTVSPSVRRKVERRIAKWKQEGIFIGFLKYLATSLKWTYSKVLQLLIYGAYCETSKKIIMVANDVFKIAAVSSYAQAVQELPEEKRNFFEFVPLAWKKIKELITVPVLGKTFPEYMEAVTMTQSDEMYNYVLTITMQSQNVTEEMLRLRMIKQGNRILLVREDKYSGGLEETARVVANQAYFENFKNIPKLQVRFVAVMDEKTTKMCRSLNGQLFYINDWNHFERYSHIQGKMVTIDLFGLIRGVNLPPIDDHFHWCRSTITYDI